MKTETSKMDLGHFHPDDFLINLLANKKIYRQKNLYRHFTKIITNLYNKYTIVYNLLITILHTTFKTKNTTYYLFKMSIFLKYKLVANTQSYRNREL